MVIQQFVFLPVWQFGITRRGNNLSILIQYKSLAFPGHLPENPSIQRSWDCPTETSETNSVEGSLAGKLQHLKLLPVDDDRLMDEAPGGVEFEQAESLCRRKKERYCQAPT